MNIYNIQYVNSDIEGVATVEATTANKASFCLQSTGRLNASEYKVTSIKKIGCNDSPVERILQETYQNKETPPPLG